MIEKYSQLVEKLQKATELRKITWENTSGANEYQTIIGENSISVRYHEKTVFLVNVEDVTYYSLLLWNKEGKNIDELRAEKGDHDYYPLKKLYESARRACGRVEETLDDVLSRLD